MAQQQKFKKKRKELKRSVSVLFFSSYRLKAVRTNERCDELEQSNKDLIEEMDKAAKRESGHLELTQKLTAKNAQLQSENSILDSKVGEI